MTEVTVILYIVIMSGTITENNDRSNSSHIVYSYNVRYTN